MNRRRTALMLGIVALTSCSGGQASSGSSERTVTVFAAASLTDAFDEIGRHFSDAAGNVRVEFNFLASSDLAAQIIEGAPADVFASADEMNMSRVVEEGIATDAVVFAENRLSIAVPAGNPRGIESLNDLQDPDLVVALCNEECPAGRYAVEIFEASAITVVPDSLEADVRGVLTRVGLGEADAGLVYATDISSETDVDGVDISEEDNVVARYPIAALEGAPESAAAFIDYVRSGPGERILTEHGFQLP